METKIYNYDSIDEDNIEKTIIRVKALIINSNNEILVGYSHDTYQFIGGHIEENEDKIEGLKREIEEESGIVIDEEPIKLFFIRKKYVKDYPVVNSNRCYEYYYYVINTNKIPNLSNVHYTENEQEGNFKLQYISLGNIEEKFEENKKVSEYTETIQTENLETIKIYKYLIKSNKI